MKVYLIKTSKMILFILIIFCVQCKTIEVQYKNGNINEAIMNSITDFKYNHKPLIKSKNVYYVSNKSFNDYYRITISKTESKHLYNPNLMPNENKFPSNFYEENNILFIWYDDNKNIDEKTIQTYLRYGLLVDNQNETIMFLDDIIDDSRKGVIYYICKNELTNFKKIKSSYVKNSHPKLKCN